MPKPPRFDVELSDLTEHLHFSPATYKRNLVRAGPHYHAWLLCWKNEDDTTLIRWARLRWRSIADSSQ